VDTIIDIAIEILSTSCSGVRSIPACAAYPLRRAPLSPCPLLVARVCDDLRGGKLRIEAFAGFVRVSGLVHAKHRDDRHISLARARPEIGRSHGDAVDRDRPPERVLEASDDVWPRLRSPFGRRDWTNEEGARFQPPMLCSLGFSGQQSVAWIYDRRDKDGIRFEDAQRKANLNSDSHTYQQQRPEKENFHQIGNIWLRERRRGSYRLGDDTVEPTVRLVSFDILSTGVRAFE
jgi:hypothetical protein